MFYPDSIFFASPSLLRPINHEICIINCFRIPPLNESSKLYCIAVQDHFPSTLFCFAGSPWRPYSHAALFQASSLAQIMQSSSRTLKETMPSSRRATCYRCRALSARIRMHVHTPNLKFLHMPISCQTHHKIAETCVRIKKSLFDKIGALNTKKLALKKMTVWTPDRSKDHWEQIPLHSISRRRAYFHVILNAIAFVMCPGCVV